MSITDAVKGLLIELEAGEEATGAIQFISKEYGLNPELVARKFREQYGVDYVGWKPKKALAKKPPVQSVNWEAMTPKEVAEEWSKKFQYPLGAALKIGVPFKRSSGEEYLFVHAHVRNINLAVYIRAVDAKTGDRMIMRYEIGEDLDEIHSQIKLDWLPTYF